ncbi:MAG: MBL fold metallo-hydrolase [Candidatus Ranarchaeia archaeon]
MNAKTFLDSCRFFMGGLACLGNNSFRRGFDPLPWRNCAFIVRMSSTLLAFRGLFLMRIVFLGTSAGVPTLGRGLAGIYLETCNERLLLDCGEGTQRQLLYAGANVTNVSIILISHLHGDHFFGLYGILQTCTLLHRRAPLLVVCPPLIQNYLVCLMRYTPFHICFPLTIISPSPGVPIRRRGYTISCVRVPHGVEAYAYCIEEDPYPGKFYPDKAVALGVPRGPLWKKLQQGHSVCVDGRRIVPGQVSGPLKKGVKLVYSGDVTGDSALARFAEKATLLIHESTYLRPEDRPRERQHATLADAIKNAEAAQCGCLVATHFSSRYRETAGLPVSTPSGIPIIYAEDLLEIRINKNKELSVNKIGLS